MDTVMITTAFFWNQPVVMGPGAGRAPSGAAVQPTPRGGGCRAARPSEGEGARRWGTRRRLFPRLLRTAARDQTGKHECALVAGGREEDEEDEEEDEEEKDKDQEDEEDVEDEEEGDEEEDEDDDEGDEEEEEEEEEVNQLRLKSHFNCHGGRQRNICT
ncbi:unnamed protein product [Merluccius merluccius]